MNAIIRLNIPDYQIGEEVSIYFKDTMMKKGVVEKEILCEDAVSRKSVIDAIEDENRNGHYSCFASNDDAQCFKQTIKDLPKVTSVACIAKVEFDDDKLKEIVNKVATDMFVVEKDKGEWLNNIHQNCTCSKCGYVCAESDVDEYKFCPNCGSDMR